MDRHAQRTLFLLEIVVCLGGFRFQRKFNIGIQSGSPFPNCETTTPIVSARSFARDHSMGVPGGSFSDWDTMRGLPLRSRPEYASRSIPQSHPLPLRELLEEFFLRVADQLLRLHVASVHDVIRDVGENICQVNPGASLSLIARLSCVLSEVPRVKSFVQSGARQAFYIWTSDFISFRQCVWLSSFSQ